MQEKKSSVHQLNACRKMQIKRRPRERIFNFRKFLLEVFVTVSWRRLLKRNMRWLCKTESWRKQRIRRMRWSHMFMICETRYLQNKLILAYLLIFWPAMMQLKRKKLSIYKCVMHIVNHIFTYPFPNMDVTCVFINNNL